MPYSNPDDTRECNRRYYHRKQNEDERERCRTDKFYLNEVLGHTFQKDVHSDLFANYLQIKPGVRLFDQDTIKDRLVLWPRAHYKTYSVVAEVIQLIINYPDIRILLMQGTARLGSGLLEQIKSHFTGQAFNSRLKEIFPEYCSDRLGTQYKFTIPARKRKELKEATVTVASAMTVKASQHYDVGFFDDLVNEKNYRNPILLRKTIQDFNQYTPLVQDGYKYVTGTRYAFGDLYDWIISKNEETHSWLISIKACWTENTDGTKTILFPKRQIEDGSSIGFTQERLEQIQKEDPEMFCAQYLNLPARANRQRFTELMLNKQIRESSDPQYPAASPVYLFVDLAQSVSKNMDHSVILAGRADRLGRSWVIDCKGAQMNSLELAQAIIDMSMVYRPSKVLIEGTAAGKFFIDYLKTIAAQHNIFLPLDIIKVDVHLGAKEMRISALEGELSTSRLFFVRGLGMWDRICKEFLDYIPGVKRHDDYPDTIALMVQYFQQNVYQTARMPSILDHPMFAPDPPSQNVVNNNDNSIELEGLGSSFVC